jgi:hypothetical protein
MEPMTAEPTTMVQTPAVPPTMGPVDPPTVTLVSAASTDDIDPSGNMAPQGMLETS